MLGLQIGYFAVFLPLVLLGILLGYQIADRGLNRLESKHKAAGAGLLLAGAGLALFCAGFLPGAGYWLVFDGGVDSFLSHHAG